MNKIENEKLKTNFPQPSYYKNIAGHQIAFYESAGKGEIVLMMHGNSSNAGNYKNQLASELGEKYHLVAFDFPGCGNSPFALEPDKVYGINGLAKVLLEIIHSLGENCWLVGHSLGSNLALYAAQQNPANIKGLFLSGILLVDKSEELAQAALPNPDMALFFQHTLTAEERQRLARAGFHNPNHEAVKDVSQGLEITDPLFRTSIAASVADPLFYVGHKQFLRAATLPVALVEAEYDAFINREYLEKQEIPALWRNKIQLVENAGHYAHLENPETMNLLLEEFICQ